PQDLPREVFAVDPTTICQNLNTEVLYRCRKCRRALFRSSSILSHTEGIGPIAFAHKRIIDCARLSGNDQGKCTSYFIEPVQWMEPVLLGVMEGQLLCPKCMSKLGSFSWRGDQCSCGRWVTPAFQIHKSRLNWLHPEVKDWLPGELGEESSYMAAPAMLQAVTTAKDGHT
ncbi:Dual specificity protein phosphatase 12, partial [Lamprotornis superbus]